MPAATWDDFRSDLTKVVAEHGGQLAAVANGRGVWESQSEDTFVVIFLGGRPIAGALSLLAQRYDQEAIALLQAETAFVYSERDQAETA